MKRLGSAYDLAVESPFQEVTARPAWPVCAEWSTVLDRIEGEVRKGTIKTLFLDIDNTLLASKTFVGSEADKNRTIGALALHYTPSQASKFTYYHCDSEERRLTRRGAYELPAGLTASGLRRLQALKAEFGIEIHALSARPNAVYDITCGMLQTVGIVQAGRGDGGHLELDGVHLVGGIGAAKSAKIREVAGPGGVATSALVDDTESNVRAVVEAGSLGIHLDFIDPHEACDPDHYLDRLDEEPSRPMRFEWAAAALKLKLPVRPTKRHTPWRWVPCATRLPHIDAIRDLTHPVGRPTRLWALLDGLLRAHGQRNDNHVEAIRRAVMELIALAEHVDDAGALQEELPIHHPLHGAMEAVSAHAPAMRGAHLKHALDRLAKVDEELWRIVQRGLPGILVPGG